MAYEGRDMGLAPLSRSKTSRLPRVDPQEERGGWRFQWERGPEILRFKEVDISLVER
jgi:hypothetical protein